MPLAVPKPLLTALGFCREGVLRFPGKKHWEFFPRVRQTCGISLGISEIYYKRIRWNIHRVPLGNPSECLLAFPSPCTHSINCSGIPNLLPNDAMKGDLNQALQSVGAIWGKKDKCYLCLKLLWAEMAQHTQEMSSDLSVLDSLSARQRSRSWWRACNSAWSLCSRSRLPL